jgi:uncharacterized protein
VINMLSNEIEVKIGALIMDPNNSTPIVVLKSLDDSAILPIWVGIHEANAIALEIEKISPQRPMTHDLIRNLIFQLGYHLKSVTVTELKENTFFANIALVDSDGNDFILDARPSDALAIALRLDCPIYVNEDVFKSSATRSIQDNLIETNQEASDADEWSDWVG